MQQRHDAVDYKRGSYAHHATVIAAQATAVARHRARTTRHRKLNIIFLRHEPAAITAVMVGCTPYCHYRSSGEGCHMHIGRIHRDHDIECIEERKFGSKPVTTPCQRVWPDICGPIPTGFSVHKVPRQRGIS